MVTSQAAALVRSAVSIGVGMALACGTAGVLAQAYPTKTVRIIVPLAAGGSTDTLARLTGNKLAEVWGHNVLVENRPGAGTTLGADLVAKSPADGYTLLMVTSAFSVNFSLMQKVPYKASDFAALSNVGMTPNVLAVHPSLPVKNLKDLIVLMKQKPGQMTYSSGGVGGSTHLSGELFKMLAGVDMIHVPYKGGNPAVTDLVAGQVTMTFGNLTTIIPFAKAGRLRALAVTSAKRSPQLPEMPTMAEAGVPGFEASTWNGLIAPAATPKEIVAKLNADIVKVLAMPDMKEKLAVNGFEPVGDTSAQFQAFITAEIERWSKVVRTANIKPE